MRKYLFIALAAIAALSSCSKENLVANEENGKEAQVFTATMEDGITSKATFDQTNKCALWEVGDVISIDGHEYTADQAGASSTFTGSGATESTHHAYFPASLYNGGTPTLPANVSEKWAEGQFNMPMYAESPDLNLSFKNLCGVLKITVTSAQLTSVECITVSSTNCATSGAFNVTDKKAVLTDASNTANTVTVTYTDAVATDATGKVFYVAIPAQTYKNLSIAVSDGTTTKVMTTTKDQDITVARNTVYPITFDGQPTTGTAKRTGDFDVNWVQLWASGPKFAEYNVGAENNKAEDYGGDYTWTVNDDTATNLWGSNWRMPTKAEFENLLSNCNVAWTTVNGKSGRKFTGKGAYASNSVFLPAAFEQGRYGAYWSSTPTPDNSGYDLYFESDSQEIDFKNAPFFGISVRAVLAEE